MSDEHSIEALTDLFTADDEGEPTRVVTDTPFRIAKGKYKGITRPRIGEKITYVEKVEALRREIEADPEFQRHASELTRMYVDLRREADRLAEDLAECRLRLMAVSSMMVDQMEVEDTTSITLRNGDQVRIQYEPHLVVVDKEAFRQWCLKNGFEQQMVLPWGTGNKLVKEMLVNGEAEPEGTGAFIQTKIVFRSGGHE